MTTFGDQAYAIRTHLLYELKFMIFAAARLEEEVPGILDVALIDSATVHARNLFEFASKKGKPGRDFTLYALGGTTKESGDWGRWANNRVTHMLEREHHKAPWPEGLDNNRRDRLTVMAGAVLNRLEEGGESIPSGPVRDAFFEVVGMSRHYWSDPSDGNHDKLAALYDASRDSQAGAY